MTADPRCLVRGCHKIDTLVCRTYNAAARAVRSGNALAILLAATRRSVGPEDPDTLSLVDSALTVHSQLTRDVGAAMSATVMAQRQIWLAQTSLPEGVSRDLTRMPVVPGDFTLTPSACLKRQSSLVVRGSQSVAPLVSGLVLPAQGTIPPATAVWGREGDTDSGVCRP